MLPIALRRLVIVALIVTATLLIAREFGAWTTLAIMAGIAAAVCMSGVALLKTSTVGKVTWKNRVAGLMLPWGYKLGGGQLPGIALVVWLSWLLIAGITLAVTRHSPSTATVGWSAATLTGLTWLCWLILAGTAALLLYRITQFSRGGGSAHSSVVKALFVCCGLLLGSIASFAGGFPWLAFLVAAVPIVLTLLPVTVMLLVILGYSLAGKPIRWN